MQISNIKKNKKLNQGFTLIELIIVIAGIAALGSFTIPGLLNSIKLNKIEEAKALMNSYASECLGKFRISTDPADFINNSTPDQLDDMRLNTLGYMIDGEKNKCSKLGIKPSDDGENDLYSFDFRITNEGEVIKTGTPSDNPRFLNSCRSWAGKNCGLTPAQQAEFDRLEALAIAKSECRSDYDIWLATEGTGNFIRWDDDTETCSKEVWAWEGQPVNSEEAFKKARDTAFGDKCDKWIIENTINRRISPDGNPETIKECAGENFWFHNGRSFKSQTEWDSANKEYKSDLCQLDIEKNYGKDGEYTSKLFSGPPPCSVAHWICGTTVYTTLDSYNSSTCANSGDDSSGGGTGGGTGGGSGGGTGGGTGGGSGGSSGGGTGGTGSARCKNFDRKKIRGCTGFGWQRKPGCVCR